MLGHQQQPASQERLARPARQVGLRRGAGHAQPRFVRRPATLVISLDQIANRQAQLGVWSVGLERPEPLEDLPRFRQFQLFPQRYPQIAVCLGVVGPQGDGLLELRRGLLELVLVPKRDAQVVVRLGILRP